MSFATSGDIWYGPVTIVGLDSSTARWTITGMLPDKPTMSFEQKTTTITLNDGSEVVSSAGWTGTLEIPLDSFDQTTITNLETYAPGTTNDIDTVKITFTELGNGTDTYVTLNQISGLVLGVTTGDRWTLNIKLTVTGASTDDLSDLIVFTQPA